MLFPSNLPSLGVEPYLGDGASSSAVSPCLMLNTLNRLAILRPTFKASAIVKSHPVAALISSELGLVVVADDNSKVHLYDATGESFSGWPVVSEALVAGMAVYPDEQNPGIIASTIDGRIYLWKFFL